MSENELEHLVKMINQISINMPRNISEQEAASKIASHITSFWAKSMRLKICQNKEAINPKLTPAAQLALEQLHSHEIT